MIFLYILAAVLGIFIILLAIAAVRAVVIKKEYGDDKLFDMEKDCADWKTHAEHLSKIIQIPTVSIRGNNDKTQIYRLHGLLRELYPNIHRVCEVTDIDGALLFKWKGKDSSKKPILLMSHQDVVEATGKWQREPFSGDIEDGIIWGRGTVDTKGALCAILESVERLIAEGFTPAVDVYVASSNNEEITGDGAIKTVEYLYEKGIKFDLVMDEGGSVMATEDSATHRLSAHNAMIGIFEKGRANIKFIARSSGGHASVPFNNNPFARLAKLVYIIENRNPFKKKITKPVRIQYKAMAPY
ncbi:MAG: M20/M25/M40 family metallo-hydrolase, partial [Ruminiclostridium sp.]